MSYFYFLSSEVHVDTEISKGNIVRSNIYQSKIQLITSVFQFSTCDLNLFDLKLESCYAEADAVAICKLQITKISDFKSIHTQHPLQPD